MTVIHTDRAVAKRLLRGDEQAFREVFDSFFPKLYRFTLARENGNDDEAREVVQKTFCKVFERLHTYRAEASLYGWMCQICRNTIIDHGRRKQREPQHVTLWEDGGAIQSILETLATPAADEPEAQVRRMDLIRLIQATLDCLPGHYGDVLEWEYVEGLSVNEISARLGVGPKAAESALTRARSAFREAVQAIGGAADYVPDSTLQA